MEYAEWAAIRSFECDNKRIRASNAQVGTVFIGDSITYRWNILTPEFFASNEVVRGVGGQITGQMLLRFRQDVIELNPQSVHIMAGTNDVSGIAGFIANHEIELNLHTMSEIALFHGINVVIASIPPAPVDRIYEINGNLQRYCEKVGVTYADYTSVLGDGSGLMQACYSEDGVHPNASAYRAMAPIARDALAKAQTQAELLLRRQD